MLFQTHLSFFLPLLCILFASIDAQQDCSWNTPAQCPPPDNDWGNSNDRTCMGRINYWRKRACDEGWRECPPEGLPPMSECTACHRCVNSQAYYDSQIGGVHSSFGRCGEFAQGVGGGDDCAVVIDMFANERSNGRCEGHCAALVRPGCQTFHWGEYDGTYIINYRGCNEDKCQDYCDNPQENGCFGLEPKCNTLGDEPSFPVVCFSGDSTVETEHRGTIKLSAARIGDKVKVARNRYESIYSFGHYDPNKSAELLLINSMLQISHNHLIYRKDQGYVPSSILQVGDYILSVRDTQEEYIKVQNISTTHVTGVFAPFTPSGSIVVNNILASSFVTLQQDSSYLSLGGFPTPLNWHYIAYMFESPHRICYQLGYCEKTNESYQEGLSEWVFRPYQLAQWILQQNPLLACLCLLPLLVILFLVSCVDKLLLALLVLWRFTTGLL